MMDCSYSGGKVLLNGELQVSFLEPLMDCLERVLPQDRAIEVDISQVHAVDVAGLQLLLAFIRGRQGIGPTELTGATPLFHKALEITGLRNDFAKYIID
jgi:ABC-type transporter Mla MlaB component